MEELYNIENKIDNYNHNPLYNPKFKPPNAKPLPQLQPNAQPNPMQLQWKHFPSNHNLKSFNNLFENQNRANNNQKQQNNPKQHNNIPSNLPNGIKKVRFIKNKKPPSIATIEHVDSQPKLLRKYSKRGKTQSHPSNNTNQPAQYNSQQQFNSQKQYPPQLRQYNSVYNQPIPPPNKPQLSYSSSEYGQQWTSFGIPQQRPHSEPILRHTQTEPNIFQPNDNNMRQRSQTEPPQFSNNNNYNRPQYNQYMPKKNEEIRHSKVAHMYTMTAHFENNILSVEVYDSIQGNKFRNEFSQRDYTMYPVFDVAKILVDAINSTQSNKHTVSINGFKPISISEFNGWCYLTVNGTQIPSFALRPVQVQIY